MLWTSLDNPFSFPRMNFSLLSEYHLEQSLISCFKTICARSKPHPLYLPASWLLWDVVNGTPSRKKQEALIKAVSIKLEFLNFFFVTVICTLFGDQYFYLLFKLPKLALSWLHQFAFSKIQSHSFHHQIFLQRFHTSLAAWESVKTSVIT